MQQFSYTYTHELRDYSTHRNVNRIMAEFFSVEVTLSLWIP